MCMGRCYWLCWLRGECVLSPCVCENCDGWLVGWGLCGCMLIRLSTVRLLPQGGFQTFVTTHIPSGQAVTPALYADTESGRKGQAELEGI